MIISYLMSARNLAKSSGREASASSLLSLLSSLFLQFSSESYEVSIINVVGNLEVLQVFLDTVTEIKMPAKLYTSPNTSEFHNIFLKLVESF